MHWLKGYLEGFWMLVDLKVPLEAALAPAFCVEMRSFDALRMKTMFEVVL